VKANYEPSLLSFNTSLSMTSLVLLLLNPLSPFGVGGLYEYHFKNQDLGFRVFYKITPPCVRHSYSIIHKLKLS